MRSHEGAHSSYRGIQINADRDNDKGKYEEINQERTMKIAIRVMRDIQMNNSDGYG